MSNLQTTGGFPAGPLNEVIHPVPESLAVSELVEAIAELDAIKESLDLRINYGKQPLSTLKVLHARNALVKQATNAVSGVLRHCSTMDYIYLGNKWYKPASAALAFADNVMLAITNPDAT